MQTTAIFLHMVSESLNICETKIDWPSQLKMIGGIPDPQQVMTLLKLCICNDLDKQRMSCTK